MPKLMILSGKHRGKRLNLPEKTLVVGRDEGCSVRLVTTEISREHCRLRVTSDTIFVTDLGSRNGTFINDEPIQDESPLQPGDFLKVGPVLFQFEAPKPKSAGSDSTTKGIDEDSVASFLNDDDTSTGEDAGTTTIVTGEAARESARQALIPPPSKLQFETVAEEAADIFRRHKEWKRLLNEQGLD